MVTLAGGGAAAEIDARVAATTSCRIHLCGPLVALGVFCILGGLAATGCRKWPRLAEPAHADEAPASPEERFPTSINRAYGQLGVTTHERDINGKPARIACATCHFRVEAKPDNAEATAIPGFHAGVKLKHGGQACRTCHQVKGFDAFALASGKPVAYLDVINLCGQCHARRVDEYRRGIHGGMNGYWDLGRGPRDRNLCIDCHNAHAPTIGPVLPAARHRKRPGL